MAKDPIAFQQLVNSILDKSFVFTTDKNTIKLSEQGLDDFDMQCLMDAINNNEKVYSSLKGLILSNNDISIAPDLTKCQALEHFLMFNNKLTIPPDFSKCPQLISINLEKNPLVTLPEVSHCVALNFYNFSLPKSEAAKSAASGPLIPRKICKSTISRKAARYITTDSYAEHIKDFATQAWRLYQRKLTIHQASIYTAYTCLQKKGLRKLEAKVFPKIFEYVLPKSTAASDLESYVMYLESILPANVAASDLGYYNLNPGSIEPVAEKTKLEEYTNSAAYKKLPSQIAAQYKKDVTLLFSRITNSESELNKAIEKDLATRKTTPKLAT